MAYETGTATDNVDLLNKLATFIEANGWTRDSLANEASGRRYHAHKGADYFNARAYVNEAPNAAIAGAGSGVYSIAFNLGTGYSGATPWYSQAGVPQGTSSLYMTAGVTNITGAISAYHFFAHNSGGNVVVVVEYTSGAYQMFAFGTLEKHGTYTGGQYFFGSHTGVNTSTVGFGGVSSFIGLVEEYNALQTSPPNSAGSTRPGFVKVDVDSDNGWHWVSTFNLARDTSKRHIYSNQNWYRFVNGNDPATLNNLETLTPIILYIERDTNHNSSTFRSPLGSIPGLFFCDIRVVVPANQLTYGSDNYRAFPWWKRSTTATDVGSDGQQSMTLGFAVAEV